MENTQGVEMGNKRTGEIRQNDYVVGIKRVLEGKWNMLSGHRMAVRVLGSKRQTCVYLKRISKELGLDLKIGPMPDGCGTLTATFSKKV